jgi:hypothetical protein
MPTFHCLQTSIDWHIEDGFGRQLRTALVISVASGQVDSRVIVSRCKE